MNEIRMYVERLFQGKTLTDDVIELKEEIYGNLVARYEDYLAEGMSEADALAKTKASMTSIDDVVAGEGGQADVQTAGASATVDAAATPATAATATVPVTDPSASGAAPTTVLPQAQPGAPTNPVTGENDSAGVAPRTASSKKKWIIAAVIAVVVLGVLALGMAVVDELAEAREDRIEAQRDRQRNTDDASISIDKNGISVKNGDDEVTIDSNGVIRLDGDLADELLTEVVNGGVDTLQPFANTELSDGANVEQAVRALPMSMWFDGIDTTKGAGVLSVTYQGLPDFDGDSIDAALVYDATALFCLIPEMNELHIAVSEANDSPNDRDYYVFQRATLEGKTGYGVALNSDMLNENNWSGQIKRDNLYKANFVDRIIDQSETE